MKKTMQAQVIHSYGGPEKIHLEEVSIPSPGPDEVLIRVAATSFNPVDGAIRSGMLQAMTSINPYLIPGLDVSGVVEEVGSAVINLHKGQKVYAFLDMFKSGASAEYVVSQAAVTAPAPERIPLTDSASVPLAAVTAYQALFDQAGINKHSRVLITGAAGGVGTFAVQLAKSVGAVVIGTASDRSFAMLKELGIDEIIDYKKQVLADALSQKVDAVINLAPLPPDEVTKLLYLLKKGGILVSIVNAADDAVAAELGVKAVSLVSSRNAERLTRIASLIDAGKINPVITGRVSLNDLPSVHEKSANHLTQGKIILIINDHL